MTGNPTPAERWRLLLGADEPGNPVKLSGRLQEMDRALAALYDSDGRKPGGSGRSRGAGLGSSTPSVTRWLGDIRSYFPSRVVRVMQTDAIERLGLRQLLLEPEVLEQVEPDVNLVATLASLSSVLPERSKATAREVVARVVRQVEERIAEHTRQAVRGALNRAARTNRPKPGDINWPRTIQANLGNYLPEHRTVVPERLVGFGRRSVGVQREIVVCLDQSGSMAESVVYASIFAAVMAQIRALKTSLVAYDTSVVDLTDRLTDPVDVIFGTQLGGGTNTSPALAYCESLITKPAGTVLVLISDLYDTTPEKMLRRLNALVKAGVTVVVLLALDDAGTPSYNHGVAASLAGLGIPAFGCTPDAFPELLALAINGGDIGGWAERNAAAADSHC